MFFILKWYSFLDPLYFFLKEAEKSLRLLAGGAHTCFLCYGFLMGFASLHPSTRGGIGKR